MFYAIIRLFYETFYLTMRLIYKKGGKNNI